MSRTVLVVDDEADLLLMLRFTIETAGYRFLGASSGEEALAVLAKETPDVVILDLVLPGMGGWAVLERLQEVGVFPKVPVFIASAHASGHNQLRAKELGCSGYLTKPFGTEDFLSALRSVFDSHPVQNGE